MADIIRGPWKPFAASAVTKESTGTWQCTVVPLRPRRAFPTEASLQRLKDELAARLEKSAAAPPPDAWRGAR
jgi:hypothetical protein